MNETAPGPEMGQVKTPVRQRKQAISTITKAEPAVSKADQDVHEYLARFTQRVAASLAGEGRQVWCTVTILSPGRPKIVAASGKQARAQEAVLLRLADVSYLRSVREHTLIHVGDTGTDQQWGPYAAAAVEQGIRSVLVMPFELASVGPATLTLGCDRPHAFDSAQIRAVQLRLEAVSETLRNAADLRRHPEKMAELGAVMASRIIVHQAVNQVVYQNRCTAEEAFHLLRRTAEDRGMPLRELAVELVAVVRDPAGKTRKEDPRGESNLDHRL